MREVALDTETTGLDPESGHRVVEIGAVELVNYIPTGREYHTYLNPERDMPEEAFKVHQLSEQFLADKPLFADCAARFLDFIGDAKLIIHNAAFDLKFLNAELRRSGHGEISQARAIDTVALARKSLPGAQVSLDALCRRFGIDLSLREQDGHGALLDTRLLAEVYLELRGGRQPDLVLGSASKDFENSIRTRPARKRKLIPVTVSPEEAAAHAAFVQKELGEDTLWADEGGTAPRLKAAE